MRAFIITFILLLTISFFFFSGTSEFDEVEAPQRVVTINGNGVEQPAKIDGKVHSLRVKMLGGRLSDIFSDSNAIQLEAAEKIGITPITDLRTAYNLRTPIRKVNTCDAYVVDSLRHSMPYLIPKAADLLAEIGQAFTDTVSARGGKKYKIKVTSVMRTDNTVSSLRKRNRNATTSSCHRFGTTFDISYTRFICCDSSYIVSQADLKNILAEVLYDLRKEGRCYVKYEVKQSCFHITTR